jgi:hypothetical protein
MRDTEHNHAKADGRDEGNDLLASELDRALAKYAAVEPRTGLEDRVLANLRARRRQSLERNWWRWSAAVALAAMIIVAAVVLRSSWPSQPIISTHPSPTRSAKEPPAEVAFNAIRPKQTSGSKARPGRKSQPVEKALPKLDQFPSPQPLSEEELALARYVQSFPKEATLIAQAQREFELEIQKEMNNAGSESRPSGSTQQER